MHAAFCNNRFEVGADGITPYHRVRGKPFDHSICEFGECVLALNPKEGVIIHSNKFDSRWFDGIFLGMRGLIKEFKIGTPNGIRRARTVRHKPST